MIVAPVWISGRSCDDRRARSRSTVRTGQQRSGWARWVCGLRRGGSDRTCSASTTTSFTLPRRPTGRHRDLRHPPARTATYFASASDAGWPAANATSEAGLGIITPSW